MTKLISTPPPTYLKDQDEKNKEYELTMWDPDNERSLINLVSPEIRKLYLDTRDKRPELFEMNEYDLIKLLRDERSVPNPTVHRIRMLFWQEYDLAQAEVRQLEMWRVYKGVCDKEMLWRMCHEPKKLAWILCPTVSYMVHMQESLNFGLEQLREALGADHTFEIEKNGKKITMVNTKLLEIKAKIVAMLDMRVKGAVTQKIEQTNKNMNLNLNATEAQVNKIVESMSNEEIMKELEKIRKKREKQARVVEKKILDASSDMVDSLEERPLDMTAEFTNVKVSDE